MEGSSFVGPEVSWLDPHVGRDEDDTLEFVHEMKRLGVKEWTIYPDPYRD